MKKILLALVSIAFTAQALSAQEIANIEDEGVSIQLSSSGQSSYRLSVGHQSQEEPDVFALSNPTRLVIDIPKQKTVNSKTLSLRHPLFTSIRRGRHPNKTRLVLDITSGSKPEYTVTPNAMLQSVTVEFDLSVAEKREIKTASAPIITAPSDPVPEKINSTEDFGQHDYNNVEPEPVIQDEPKKAEIKEEPKPAKVVEQPAPSNSTTVVSSVKFEKTPGESESAIVIEANNLEGYSLRQLEPNLYQLSFNNASLAGEHLSLPQFPPDTYEGFELTIGSEEGKKVLIRIYVEEGYKLFPFISKDKLWIKVGN